MDYEVKDYTEEDIPRLMTLFQTLYEDRRRALRELPPLETFRDFLASSYKERFGQHAFGKTLWHQGTMVGFMIGIKIKQFWGQTDGFLSPLHGHGVLKHHQQNGYPVLYQSLAPELLKRGLTSHAFTIDAQDAALEKLWFHMGFGLRCIDAIKLIKKNPGVDDTLEFSKLDKTSIEAFVPLEAEFHAMWPKPPLFMPTSDEDAKASLLEFLSGEGHVLYGAYRDGVPVGMIQAKPTGENVVTTSPFMMNITGLFVPQSLRGQGIAKALLGHLENELAQLGFTHLGTDYESFNLSGSTFWHRHFSDYTHTVHRRVDEGILPFYEQNEE